MKLDRAFGTAVLNRRRDAGLTQEQLAETLHMQTSAVSRLERGVVSPKLTMVDRVARALGTTPWQLLKEAEQHLERAAQSQRGSPRKTDPPDPT